MSARDSERTRLEDTAAEWVVRRDAGFSAAAKEEFALWSSDPRHAAAFAEMEATLAMLKRPRDHGQARTVIDDLAAWEREWERKHRRRILGAWATLGLAAAACMTVAFLSFEDRRPYSPANELEVQTVAVRPEQQHLADGSVVELDADAEIQIEFSAEKRGVRVVRGAVHFSVAKEERPFVVQVGNVEVRAVGTQFAVRLASNEVDVLVTEGRVAVGTATFSSHPGGAADPVLVSAGGQVSLSAASGSALPAEVKQVAPEEIHAALAWRGMRFEFTGAPLADAVDLFNRKSGVRISLADASLGAMRISGIYWANNPDGFARLLESSLDVVVVRESPDHIVLRRP